MAQRANNASEAVVPLRQRRSGAGEGRRSAERGSASPDSPIELHPSRRSQEPERNKHDAAREERELVRRLVDGDKPALSQLYKRLGPTAFALALRLLGSWREAEDVLHDVFIEAWQKVHTYDPRRGSVRSWILIRTRSRALDRLRSPARTRSSSLDEMHDGQRPVLESEDPAGAADRSAVRAAVAALPQSKREVLEMAYFGGLSSTEISKDLGIPVGTVKSRVRAGLVELRRRLR